MNHFERVRGCFAFEETDRPPVWDWIRNDAVIAHFAGHPLAVKNGRAACMETYRQVLDATKQEMRFPREEGVFVDQDGRRHRQDRWTEWMDADPSMMEQDVLVSGIRDKIREYAEWDDPKQQELAGLVRDWREKQEEASPVMVFPCIGHVGLTEAYEYTGGIERFSYLLCDEPVLMGDYLSALCRHTLDRLAHLPEDFRPFAVFVGEDIGYKTGLLFSPEFLREHFLVHLRKVVDAYHALGAKVLFHTDGNVWRVMDELVDAGIDGFNPIEEVSGMTVQALRQRYPGLVLCGGVDVSHLMAHGTPEQCYERTKENMKASPRGYLVGGSAEIHTGVTLENYLSLLRAVGECAAG